MISALLNTENNVRLIISDEELTEEQYLFKGLNYLDSFSIYYCYYPRPMDCKYCGQNYSSKGGLSVHIKRVHEKSTIVWVSSFKIKSFFEKYYLILFFKEVSFILHPDEKYFFDKILF